MGRVHFDVDGALAEARSLWRFADDVASGEAPRASVVSALDWTGPHAQDLRERVAESSGNPIASIRVPSAPGGR